MSKSKNMVDLTEKTVRAIYEKPVFEKRFFHSIQHTEEVVSAVQELGKAYNLSKDEMEVMITAAWLHDIGYKEGKSEDHEEAGEKFTYQFLVENDYPKDKIQQVCDLILATQRKHEPKNLKEEIIRDADMHHIGTKKYFPKVGQLRTEWEMADNEKFTEEEWLSNNLEFMKSHRFFTPVAKELHDRRKLKNIKKLEKMYAERLNHNERESELKSRLKGGADNPYKEPVKPSRGIETMYRVALRNHNQLSKIADNKANILLSINALMISIVISSLASKLDTNTALIIPTVILLVVCMVCIVFATLATRPKITSGSFSKEKLLQNKINILFFGNFYTMTLDEFEWGMHKLMESETLLYSSLSKDLYYLGVVLAKKYTLLRAGYNFFMVGIVIAALSFIAAFIYMRSTGSFI